MRVVAALAVLALLAAVPADAQVTEKKVEEYLNSFWASALWRDSGATGSSTLPIAVTRFPDGVKLRIAVGGSMGDTYRNQVVSRIGPFLASAKIDYEILPADDDTANVRLKFINFRPSPNLACITGRWPRDGVTTRATLGILDTVVNRCLAHEIMHVIGFVGHPHDSNSVLSYVHQHTDFTEIDRMLVRVLYDPRLQPGLGHLLAMATARDVLVDLLISDGAPGETREYGRRFVSSVPATMEKMIAANQVNKTALGEMRYQLGVGYSNGYIVAKDEARGYRYFREVIELFPDWRGAQFQIAYSLRTGRGTAVNLAEAMEWYKKSANRGHSSAQTDLGYAYWKGEGVGKDLIEAYKWFELAAERGQENAARRRSELRQEISDAGLQEAVRRAKAWKPVAAAE